MTHSGLLLIGTQVEAGAIEKAIAFLSGFEAVTNPTTDNMNSQRLRARIRICLRKIVLVSSIAALMACADIARTSTLTAQEKPSAVALLRGVELAREAAESVKAEIEVKFATRSPATSVTCLVELRGARRRFEVFGVEDVAQVIIRDGDEFRSFRRQRNEDLHFYDVREAVGTRGDLAFDPRVLGLSDFMPCNANLRQCLWYSRHDELVVIGEDDVGSVRVWRVKARRGSTSSEYWIEEPSFRVHRRRIDTPDHTIDIRSTFEGNGLTPFPKRVIASREFKDARDGKATPSTMRWEYIVKGFEAGGEIPDERFGVASIGLPINTPAVDYRIHRTVGYWNGEGFGERPVYSGETPRAAPEPPSRWLRRIVFIGVNAVVVLVAALLILWLRKRA